MSASKKPADLDETTLRIAERMLRMPPKPHSEMKIGKRASRVRKMKRAAAQGGRPRNAQGT
jgi:hypothetical protein